MMGGEEKKVPDGNDAADEAQATADEAQAAADTVAADPNSTPDEVAAAKTKAKAAADKAEADAKAAAKAATEAEAERVRLANMTFRQKVIDGQYPTFAGCWAAGSLEGREFACCENVGTPYPEPSDGVGYIYCEDNT